MKRFFVVLLLVLLSTSSQFYSQTHEGSFGIRGGLGTDISGGLGYGLGINYLLNETSSVKASYARTNQYIQVAQNSTAGTPLDIWFPASPNVRPQISDQIALGYFRNFKRT